MHRLALSCRSKHCSLCRVDLLWEQAGYIYNRIFPLKKFKSRSDGTLAQLVEHFPCEGVQTKAKTDINLNKMQHLQEALPAIWSLMH